MVGRINISINIIFFILIAFSNNSYSDNQLFGGSIAYLPLSQKESSEDFYYKNHLITKIQIENKPFLMFGIPYYSNEGINEYIFESTNIKKIINLKISEKKYSSQYINIKKYTTRTEDELTRINIEKNELKKAKKKRYDQYPDRHFIMPAQGVTSGVYGTQRYYNGKRGRFHNGHDIAAEKGTYIFAPSDGKVMLTGNYYYNGKFVMINHGNNLISMFLHMDDISVSHDDIIKKGEKIGTVGNTGMSTGPHLHWSVIINNEYINPLLLIE